MKSNSYISYEGHVSLKVMHGGKVVQELDSHNEGSVLLMRFLAYCLGSNYDATKAPRYLMAYHIENPGMEGVGAGARVTSRPVATNFYPTYSDNGTDTAKVALSFLLPSTLIDTSKTITRLALYAGNDLSDSSYMAWVAIDPITMAAGESLLVLWEMTLQNAPEPEE